MNFKGKLIKKGKVKDIYDINNKLLFVFTNRISAFDIIIPSEIPCKGEILCKFSEFWFNKLDTPNHLLEVKEKNKMIVKKLKMIPIECIVRGYVYGSFYERILNNCTMPNIPKILAAKLSEPIFDPTTKSLEKDLPISKSEIIRQCLLNEDELEYIENKSIELYKKMTKICNDVGFIIADVKFEFGKDGNDILLADSLGPDEFRLWLKEKYVIGETQESYDKQLVRDWLITVGFKKNIDEAIKNGDPLPKPPELPAELILKTNYRYIIAFERITGQKFLSKVN